MESEIVPIRPGLAFHHKDHSAVIHLFDQLSPKKQEKIKEILQQLVDMERKTRPVAPVLDERLTRSPRAFLLEAGRNQFLHCVLIGSGTELKNGGLVLVPNGEATGMGSGARTLKVTIDGDRFVLTSNADFRDRDPSETVIAIVTGCYTRF